MPSRRKSAPQFRIELDHTALGLLFFSFLFGIGTVIAFLSPSATPDERLVTGVPFLAPTLLLVALVVRISFQPVKVAFFYEDRFTLNRRKKKRTFEYTQIEEVSSTRVPVSKVFPALAFVEQTNLRIKSEPQQITLPSNPKNRRLKTNLRLWLISKLADSSNQEIPEAPVRG